MALGYACTAINLVDEDGMATYERLFFAAASESFIRRWRQVDLVITALLIIAIGKDIHNVSMWTRILLRGWAQLVQNKENTYVDVLSLARAPQATLIPLACFGTSESGHSEIGNLNNKDTCCCNGKLATCDVDRKHLLMAGQPYPLDKSMPGKTLHSQRVAQRSGAALSSHLPKSDSDR